MAGKSSGRKKPKKRGAHVERLANIQQTAAQIQATAAKLQENPRLKERKDLPGHVATLQSQVLALAAKPGTGPPANTTDKINLDEFFSGVATSLISAQNQLDKQSADYLASVSGNEHILPSIFRIPKLSAEVKFAVEKATSSGINLFFFKDITTDQASNQQSVQFDIVASPPPPDLPRSPVMVSVVLAPSIRQSVLAKVSQPPWKPASATAVLIYQLRSGEYVLAFADTGNPGNLGVWYASTNDASGAAPIRAFGPVTPDLAPFRVIVQGLGLEQVKFLGG